MLLHASHFEASTLFSFDKTIWRSFPASWWLAFWVHRTLIGAPCFDLLHFDFEEPGFGLRLQPHPLQQLLIQLLHVPFLLLRLFSCRFSRSARNGRNICKSMQILLVSLIFSYSSHLFDWIFFLNKPQWCSEQDWSSGGRSCFLVYRFIRNDI